MNTAIHPTIEKFNISNIKPISFGETENLDVNWLREVCLAAGADDVGFVSVSHPDLAPDLAEIEKYTPWAKSLIGFVCKMNREPIRTPARSIANLEFHHTGDHVNEVAREIVSALEAKGIRAINPSMGFPMEMDEFPGKLWVISHKLVAQAEGLGKIGIHRNVIHPKFGNFILLGTVITDVEITEYSNEIDYNPCLECKLCVSACPVGAIKSDAGVRGGA
ncbi:MAG: 4Fe-4S binding protein [Proteobacteria bacterium]|nr:4Fe-4S binding protein [Pseudomonadota bacterium]